MADEQPIIIVKKKGGHAGHHGGAWKVAYSDFITSMMCFFLVMWLVTTASSATKKGIAEYFKDPGIFDKTKHGSPLEIGASGLLSDEGYQPKNKAGKDFSQIQNKISHEDTREDTFLNGVHIKKGNTEDKNLKENLKDHSPDGEIINGFEIKSGNSNIKLKIEDVDVNKLSFEESQKVLDKLRSKIKDDIEEKLKQEIFGDNPSLTSTQALKDFLGEIEIKVDGNAINIDIIDTEKVSMFKIGSSEMEKKSKDALYEIAKTLKDLPNEFEIVGHTDAIPYSGRNNYSNWELSSERANSARRILEDAGVDPNKIVSVQGRADRDLKYKDDPFSPKNRRITLRMNFSNEELIKLSEKDSITSRDDILERVNMRINEHKVKSITTNNEKEEDNIQNYDLETNVMNDNDILNSDNNENSIKEILEENMPNKKEEKKEVELNRQQELEQIIRRNSKKQSLNLQEKKEQLGKILGAPAPIIF